MTHESVCSLARRHVIKVWHHIHEGNQGTEAREDSAIERNVVQENDGQIDRQEEGQQRHIKGQS